MLSAYVTELVSPSSLLTCRALQDAYGNVAIIIDGIASLLFGPKTARFSGLIKPWDGVVYVDPICSLIVVRVILAHALPLGEPGFEVVSSFSVQTD